MKHIVIKRTKFFVDVFHGKEGWHQKDWTRFILVNKQYIKYVSGARMTAPAFDYVRKAVGAV